MITMSNYHDRKYDVVLKLRDGSSTTVYDVQREDLCIKYMLEELVGYKYCILIYPHDSGYGYQDRYECNSYNLIKK